MDTPRNLPNPAMVEDLTERELIVLRLKAQDRSNQEIANELALAVSTVKWYVRQIYGKLGVENRRQAVVRVQALGLIEGLPPPEITPRHSLPRQPTSFIGREAEIDEIISLLADPVCRLLTLVGPGGIGKTRLAIEAAEKCMTAFADGICFVRLQPIQSVELIMPTIADVLGLALDESQGWRGQLLSYLHDRAILLILDNIEHLLDGVDQVIDILATAPHIKLLVTSREALNLREEWLYPVKGLQYPLDDQAEQLEVYSAVQLFVACARRVSLKFQPDEQEVAVICQLVEGMPLALELAATWVRVLSLSSIIEQIRNGISFLTTSQHDVPARHQSLQAVFDQSWHLLSEDEQALFRSLSVFRGGFTAEAAMQIANTSLQNLAALIDKSLVRLEEDGRYDLHELLRQYAGEKLAQSPGVKESVLNRHCDYFTEFLHRRESTIHLSNQAEVLKEIDNIRAAWMRAVQQRNLAAIQKAAPSLHWLYHFQDWHDEGADMCYLAEEAASGMPTSDDARFVLGMMQLLRSFFEPVIPGRAKYPPVDIDAALAHWEGLDERPEMGLPLTRAMLVLSDGHTEPARAIAVARRSLAFSRHYDDLSGAAISLTTLGDVSFERLGNIAEAQQFLKEALAIDRELGFDLNARWVERILADIARLQGRYAEAKAHLEASVVHHRVGGIPRGLDRTFVALGEVALELDDDASARIYFEEGIVLASNLQAYHTIAEGRAGLGIMAAFQGDVNTAAASYEDVNIYLQSVGIDVLGYDVDIKNLSSLALLIGHYEQALAQYEATLSRFRNTGYRVPLMRAHSRAGHALLGLEDEARAAPYLFDALGEAMTVGALQVFLEALLGIAQLSFVPPALTVELLVLVCEHPAANRYSRTQAKRVLAMKETLLSPDKFAAALQRGLALTPESAAALVEPSSAAIEIALSTSQPLADPLSQRELDVLVLIAHGLTNQEIADRLYIGVSTVKKHINHVYSKLDVTHRAQAVARARALSILS